MAKISATTISVWFTDSAGVFSAVKSADSLSQAKRIARLDAKETQRPLRGYSYTKTVQESNKLFPTATTERTPKQGVST